MTHCVWEEVSGLLHPLVPAKSDRNLAPHRFISTEVKHSWILFFVSRLTWKYKIIAAREAAGLPTDVAPEKVTRSKHANELIAMGLTVFSICVNRKSRRGMNSVGQKPRRQCFAGEVLEQLKRALRYFSCSLLYQPQTLFVQLLENLPANI